MIGVTAVSPDMVDETQVTTYRRRGIAMTIDTGHRTEHRRGSIDDGQPYLYERTELVEPDWTRFPGWREVTRSEWESAQWQRSHCVKNIRQLRAVLGDLVDDRFYADLERDQTERA